MGLSQKGNMNRLRRAVTLLAVISVLLTALPYAEAEGSSAEESEPAYTAEALFGEDLPTYLRSLPLSADDPYRDQIPEDPQIPYTYGRVYENVNDCWFSSEKNNKRSGHAPKEDRGLLIGGNARSGHGGVEEDEDANDFNGILPETDIYINPSRLTYRSGEVEYTFYSSSFHFNSTRAIDPEHISIHGVSTEISHYRQLPISRVGLNEADLDLAQEWKGVVYSGGIQKTVKDQNGHVTETVIRNENEQGDSRLFSVRYRNAAVDGNGHPFDLILRVTELRLAAEEDVHGPIGIMEENRFRILPNLCSETGYIIEAANHEPEGIRIGAKLSFDYSIEDSYGRPVLGRLMFSVDDLDSASMASELRGDADWGLSEQGTDFKWAEGFAVLDGADSFAVVPYFNHSLLDNDGKQIDNRNGDTVPLRVSRLPGTAADGSCNGLLFTTAITSVHGEGTRDDNATFDTGFAAILKPSGSMMVSASADRSAEASIALFDSAASYRMQQGCTNGGSIVTVEAADEHPVENSAAMKVVGGGTSVRYAIIPDSDYAIYSIRIDEKKLRFSDLRWRRLLSTLPTAEYIIAEQYGKWATETNYTFVREESGRVEFSFDDIQDNHELYVEFLPLNQIPETLMRNTTVVGHKKIRTTMKIAVFLVAALAALVFAATVLWMKGDRKRR